MTSALRTELPRWLSSASVAWLGALLALLTLALAAGFVRYDRSEFEQRELHSSEMFARVLEDHANRSFNTIDIALGALAGSLRKVDDAFDVRPMLLQAQQGMPFLRSLSLLDANGRVLASSAADNVAVVIDLRRVPLPAPGRVERLGSLVPGRDLADIGTATNAHSFIPLVRLINAAPEAPRYLAAVLNPDFFANEQQLTLADPGRRAALIGIDGVLLSSTENIRANPGSSLLAHRFFSEFLPGRERGSFIGTGIDGGKVVTALRLLRMRPIAVVVERDYADVQAEWQRSAGWVGTAAAVVLLAIAAVVGTAWRSLRSFGAVQVALSATRDRVAASERDLRALVESVHELIFRTDALGRIGFVNQRWDHFSGRAGSDVLGQRLADLCLPEGRERIEALFAADAGGGATVQIRTAAGELRTLEISVAPVRDAWGVLGGFAGFAVDVSERQLARQKLQDQLDFTAQLIDVNPTPLFVKDERGRFLTVNRAWLDLMALKPEQVIGHDSAGIYGAEGSLHQAHDDGVPKAGDRISYQNRMLRPDGEVRDTLVTKVRIAASDGGPAGIVGSIVDVTEFREAERSTRAGRDAAERADRAKSEFIANISHELRTPLQSILGFSEMGRSLAEAEPELQEMFGDIHAGGRRMLTLVNALLDVSKLDSTVGSLSLQRQDIAPLFAQVVRELRPLAAQRRLRIEPAEIPQRLDADVDAFRIQQVFRNVLANALRFAPAGSSVEIAWLDDGGAGIDISVRDHGPGIPGDELELIFDAFVQSSRTRDGSGGTGLGLTICRKIMGAHGGSIAAANAEGGGALMRLRLPAPRPVVDQAAESALTLAP